MDFIIHGGRRKRPTANPALSPTSNQCRAFYSGSSPAPLAIFFDMPRGSTMNSETSESITSMNRPSGSTSLNSVAGSEGTVRRVAQKAHEAVDKLEQTLGSSSEKVMGWQQEYGEMAREQVRANPLAIVAGAFAIGYLLAKITR
jgi:ElaB/YqjD/DUF883 family membrane-anchored ribosome-binding protein